MTVPCLLTLPTVIVSSPRSIYCCSERPYLSLKRAPPISLHASVLRLIKSTTIRPKHRAQRRTKAEIRVLIFNTVNWDALFFIWKIDEEGHTGSYWKIKKPKKKRERKRTAIKEECVPPNFLLESLPQNIHLTKQIKNPQLLHTTLPGHDC